MKEILKKYLPSPEYIRNHKHLGNLKEHLKDPSIWSFNRKPTSKAFAIGLFLAFIPIPFQMILAAIAAIYMRANIAISIALVWITNPITMGPIYYVAYKVGALISGYEVDADIEITFDSFLTVLGEIWQPFMIGSFVFSIVFSIVGYYAIQGIYRYKIYRRKRK